MNRKSISILLILVVAAIVAAVLLRKPDGSGKGATGKTKVVIGHGPWIGFGPLYLAKEKGYFAEQGIDVDLVVLTGLAERNSALQTGRIDALAAPVDYFVLAAGNGIQSKIVMAIDESVGGDGIVAKKEIVKIEDLKGKKLAFQQGLPSDFFVRAVLLKSGGNIADIQTVDMETDKAGAAFIAGQVDAAAVWEPWLTKAVESGSGHVLASTKEFPNLIVDCLAFNSDRVAKDPATAKRVVTAVLKAIEFHKAHPDEANAIMAPHFQLDPKKFAIILSGARLCDKQRNMEFFGTDKSGPIFEVGRTAAKIWKAAGVSKSEPEPNSVIDSTILKGL